MSLLAPTSAAAFELRYRNNSDPWNFASSDYEQSRYRSILAALRRTYYQSAFEPGCSIGELTIQLAPLCNQILASDFAQSAVKQAQIRCAAFPQVEVRCADLATGMHNGPFDLIIFSEIGYYFDEHELGELSVKLWDRLMPGGEIVAAHWLGNSADHVLHGDVVHQVLLSRIPFNPTLAQRHDGFRLDAWSKA